MTIRVLQFGTTGQVGRELAAAAGAYPVEFEALSRTDVDFAHPKAAARAVALRRPDLVVIAAAYTAVDQAESDEAAAHRINAEAPAAVARACAEAGSALVHFSTDYVFDGRKGSPYAEQDAPAPLNAYGRSKLTGENLVLAETPRAAVFRTSWVVSPHGRNFLKTMLRLGREGGPIRVVDDQWGRPTSAADLARFVLSQAERLAAAQAGDPAFGLTHFANAGETSWRGFAQGVLDQALGAAAPKVEAIATADRPAPAARPARGTLDTGRLQQVFGVVPRPWTQATAEILDELARTEKASAA
jgi:dTDP-4-dehydrorhamnose reductase